jgi:hypothetical protein
MTTSSFFSEKELLELFELMITKMKNKNVGMKQVYSGLQKVIQTNFFSNILSLTNPTLYQLTTFRHINDKSYLI